MLSIRHQIPGGMTGTLKAQLAQHNMTDKLDEVLRETAEVRRDLGYPGMATPFSQLVGIQAVLNIVTGKRYSIVPDEVIQYAAGFYGETVAPIDPNVRDMIMATPRAKQVVGAPPEQPTIEELRKRYGTEDDDELILRARGARARSRKDARGWSRQAGFSAFIIARTRPGSAAHARRQVAGGANPFGCAHARFEPLGRVGERPVRRAVVVDVVRSPFAHGRAGGALEGVHPVDLYAQTLQALVRRTGVDPGLIEDVITGCVIQIGEQSGNIGRQAVLAAGLPERVPAVTLDRKCGSAQQAFDFAAQGVIAGAYDLVVAGGVEMMSLVPMRANRMGKDNEGPAFHLRYPQGLVLRGCRRNS